MIGQCAATTSKGTVPVRKGSAEATTIRLMALFRITAGKASKPNRLISMGEPEFGSAKADEPAQCTDQRAARKSGNNPSCG